MRKKSILTEKQAGVADMIACGHSESEATRAIYNSNNTNLARAAQIKEAVKEAQSEASRLSTINRLDVIQGLMESIDMARTLSEPATMIAGWDKIAKIVGAYAPEVKKIELSASQELLKHRFETMSSEELLALAEGKHVINGHATRLS